MKNPNLIFIALGAASVLFLSLPWLVPHLGFLALVGFVPLLMMDVIAGAYRTKNFFLWYFGVFLLWNACTTFWVCNATVGGGIFACVANAFQMAFVFFLFRLSKKRFKGILPYLFLALAWIAWERIYFNEQISWPWLTLGNSLAMSPELAQWYEYTGALGGSLWIWISNIVFLYLTMGLLGGFREMKLSGKLAVAVCTPLIVLGPAVFSIHTFHNYESPKGETVDVIVAQPNFDPYHKFESMTQAQQNAVLIDLFREEMEEYDVYSRRPTLLVAPETFTSDVVLNAVESGKTWNEFKDFLTPYRNANLLYGASTYEYIQQASRPSYTVHKIKDGLWVQSRNSAMVMDNTGRTEVYHKSKLVVGTELTPHPAFFTKIDDKLGGVMGRCVGQPEVSALHINSYDSDGDVEHSIPFGCAVCYESVYGEYCTGYVRKGAKFMTVITNDAWWGDTPGYRQHLSYSSLRAIELRRDIARCGNTGISAFINQKGEVVQASGWWCRQTLKGSVTLNSELTFFARHGDLTGLICLWLSVLLTLLLAVLAAVAFFGAERQD